MVVAELVAAAPIVVSSLLDEAFMEYVEMALERHDLHPNLFVHRGWRSRLGTLERCFSPSRYEMIPCLAHPFSLPWLPILALPFTHALASSRFCLRTYLSQDHFKLICPFPHCFVECLC